MDPVASLRCWPIEVELAGRTFEIPALPAADWFLVLLTGDLVQLFDYIDQDFGDPDSVDEMILSGQITSQDLVRVMCDAIEEAAGRSLTAAFTLAGVAGANWAVVGGALAYRGFRWDSAPLGAALDAIYAVLCERLDETELQRLDAALTAPLPGSGRQADRDKARRDFEAMAGPRPDSARSNGEQSGNGPPRNRRRPQRPHPDDRSRAPIGSRGLPAESGRQASPSTRLDGEPPTSSVVPPLPQP